MGVRVKMWPMTNTLPIPNPFEWMTVAGVAQFMGVDRRTVERMITKGTLTGHKPYGADGEKVPYLIWRDEAITVRNARVRLASGAVR
jgi:excisionase family DNA binding protein